MSANNLDISFLRLKHYPHFDAPIPTPSISALVTNPERVARHSFMPFIYYDDEWQPFDKSRAKKSRRIRYAARCDAYIYRHYREILSPCYEDKLSQYDLSRCVLAYRKLKTDDGKATGKCNIHFAAEAFECIRQLGECVVVSLDIEQYFERIDHVRLKKIWQRLLNVDSLPNDHYAVYKNITQYREVNRDALYSQLGFLSYDNRGAPVYTHTQREMPKQLCAPHTFRKAVAGQGKDGNNIIEKNTNKYGIPQGSPISDLLANAYLIEFDREMNQYARNRGGMYFRYSDDILIILPGDGRTGRGARQYAANRIRQYGEHLSFKSRKTYVVRFMQKDDIMKCCRVWAGSENLGKHGIEYLGFRFDGKGVYIRESTIANLNRRMKKSLNREIYKIIRRFPGKSHEFILSQFDINGFMNRYQRVRDFDENPEYQNWTFWSYAKRAADVMGRPGQRIFRQLSNQRKTVLGWADVELQRQLKRRRRSRPCNPPPPGL